MGIDMNAMGKITRAEVEPPKYRGQYVRTLEVRSLHYVEGRTKKEENPTLQRIAKYDHLGRPVSFSPEVRAWLRKLEQEDSTNGDDNALAARLASLPAPSWLAPMEAYRTHSQRMSAFFRELDKANKGKTLEWFPITEERAQVVITGRYRRDDGKLATRDTRAPEEWSHEGRQKAISAATKRGDTLAQQIELAA